MTRFEDPIRGFSRSALVWGEADLEVHGIQRLAARLPLEQAPGPAEVLIAPATLVGRVSGRVWGPDSALVVLTGPGRGYLDAAEVDRLWKVFRVPCFERLCDSRGDVVASECEAHSGLHVLLAAADWSVEEGILHAAGEAVASIQEVREGFCGCGVRCQKVLGAGPVIARRAA